MLVYYHQQIEQQQRLLRQIRKSLPPPLAQQARHCLISGKKLLVYTDSAVWASQLRFYSKAMLAAVVVLGASPELSVQIKVNTDVTVLGKRKGRTANLPSSAAINNIRSAGLALSDQTLQASLLKLSSTLGRLAAKGK